MSALPHLSDVDLFRYSKRIIDLNPEINGRCSRLLYGPAGAELLEDFLFSYRSELPWFCGVNACHRSMRPGQSIVSHFPNSLAYCRVVR
jgi:hypothetical protein